MRTQSEKDGTVRVAAVQFAVGTDVDANLATCVRMIDEAAKTGAKLVVLPEFLNHLSWYEDQAHCERVSVPMGGEFFRAVAERAKRHGIHVVANCTVRRHAGRVSGTSVLFDSEGIVRTTADKQVLMGHENDFLTPASEPSAVVTADLGGVSARLGLYACMDGVIAETPRSLALRGAQILCNSLNSFAPDEAQLHVPVRAAENKVFVVAANKVGPLLPEALLEPVSKATNIPVRFLYGAGESQIVAPDGTVLAKAPRDAEAVIFANIDPRLADCKTRPDGTDIFAARRPELYGPIGEPPRSAPAASARTPSHGGGARESRVNPGSESPESRVDAGVYQFANEGPGAVAEANDAILNASRHGVSLLVLPELFCFKDGVVPGPPAQAAAICREVVGSIAAGCRRARAENGFSCVVVTSIVEASGSSFFHMGVLIGEDGVRFRQPQVHASARHRAWASLGDSFSVREVPWGRLAIVVGDDSIYPETFRLLAIQQAEVVAVPTHLSETWESETGLLERSAENRVCLAAASRVTPSGQSVLTSLWNDFTLLTPWETRPFDGHISLPRYTRAARGPGLTRASLHPAHTHNKTLSHRTHLVDGRPYKLAGAITRRDP